MRKDIILKDIETLKNDVDCEHQYLTRDLKDSIIVKIDELKKAILDIFSKMEKK